MEHSTASSTAKAGSCSTYFSVDWPLKFSLPTDRDPWSKGRYGRKPVPAAISVLSPDTLLRPVVNRINQLPIDTLAVELTNTVYVVAQRKYQKKAMRQLEEALETAGYSTQDLVIQAFGDDAVEIETVLLATGVDGDELDRVARQLAELPFLNQGFLEPKHDRVMPRPPWHD